MEIEYAIDFLEYSYSSKHGDKPSGKSYKELVKCYFNTEKPDLCICIMKAYDDLKRNLRGIGSMNPNKKSCYKDSTVNCIKEHLCLLVNVGSQGEFDKWHYSTCRCLMAIADEYGVNCCLGEKGAFFSYGIAQKWLNMTIKYLLITGLSKDYNIIDKYLHVPIDSCIYKAYGEPYPGREYENKYALYGTFTPVNHPDEGEAEKLSVYVAEGKNRTQPWSKLNAKDYQKLQKSICCAIKQNKDERINKWVPIQWENPAWIEQARIEKRKKDKKKQEK